MSWKELSVTGTNLIHSTVSAMYTTRSQLAEVKDNLTLSSDQGHTGCLSQLGAFLLFFVRVFYAMWSQVLMMQPLASLTNNHMFWWKCMQADHKASIHRELIRRNFRPYKSLKEIIYLYIPTAMGEGKKKKPALLAWRQQPYYTERSKLCPTTEKNGRVIKGLSTKNQADFPPHNSPALTSWVCNVN